MPTGVYRIEVPGITKARGELTRFESSVFKLEKRLEKLKQAGGRAVQPSNGAKERRGGAAIRPMPKSQESFLTSVESSLTRAGTTVTTIHDFLVKIKDTVQAVNDLISTFKTTLTSLLDMLSFLKGLKKGTGKNASLSGQTKARPIKKENKLSTAKLEKQKRGAIKSSKTRIGQAKTNTKISNKGRDKTKSIISKSSISGKGSKLGQLLTERGGVFSKFGQKGKGVVGKFKGLKLPYVDIALGAAEIMAAGKGKRLAKAKEIVMEKGGAAVGTAVGTVIGGPLGGVMGSYLGSFASEKLFEYLESKFASPNQNLKSNAVRNNKNHLIAPNNPNLDSQPISYKMPSGQVRQDLQVTVNVSPDFNINTYIDADEVLGIIKSNLNTLTEEIGERLAETLQGTWSNTVLDGGN